MKRFIVLILVSLAGSTLANRSTDAKASSGGSVAPSSIAKEFGISQDSVEMLKTLFHVEDGDVAEALRRSKESGRSVHELLARMKDEDAQWTVANQSAKQQSSAQSEDANVGRKIESKADRAERRTQAK